MNFTTQHHINDTIQVKTPQGMTDAKILQIRIDVFKSHTVIMYLTDLSDDFIPENCIYKK